ncbi:MAG: tail protein X [Amaricoccus sp.]|uniref:tail protein X n=1 Tax=Amaricoccus sp. TaxID=1872485 RepID=UPI0039E305C4
MTTTTTLQTAEALDAVCRRVYGDESGYVEAVLDANPGLTGRILPAGTVIVLPDLAPPAAAGPPVVTLWT